MDKISKILGLKNRGGMKLSRPKRSEISEVEIRVEADTSSIGSSSGQTLPSPNTSLLVTPSRGSDQKHETPSQYNGAFFQNPDGVYVSGGRFNSSVGHHIMINFPHTGLEGSAVQRASRITVASSPAESLHSNLAVETREAPEGTSGISISVENSATSGVEMVAQRGNETYERHLLLKGRGFPLWIPEPNNRLTLEYRRRGINIGDVGMITPSGGFSYLFNICVPRGHPLNPDVLPEDFVPLIPPLHSVDIREFAEFKGGSHLASASIEISQSDLNTPGLVFETSASEGAVLTMPKGAVALDLENIPSFRKYVAANVDKWYKFVNGVRGREAKNGEVRVVIGCDKTASWGMAAITNVAQQKPCQLKFKILEEPSAKSSTTAYTWEYFGSAEVRVGPDAKEINALRNGDVENPPSTEESEEEFSNQCLFVRTLNTTLSDKAWNELNETLGSPSVLDSNSFSQTTFMEPPSRAQGRTFGTTINTQQTSSPSSGRQRSSHPLNMVDGKYDERSFIFSTTQKPAVVHHPSDGLNKLLVKEFPSVRMVMTLDKDWSSGIEEGEETFPDPQRLLERLTSSHDIKIDDGILFLEAKTEIEKYESSNHLEDITWIPSEGGSITTETSGSVYALATAIYKLSVGIVTFVGQRREKGPLITNISDIACQIQSLIVPLRHPNQVTYDSVKQALQTLQKVLARTDQHLRTLKESRTQRLVAFVKPSAVTSELKEDREQLVHQCIFLMVAIQVGNLNDMRHCGLLLPSADDNTSTLPDYDTSTLPDYDTSTLPDYNEVALSRGSSQVHIQDSRSILKPTLPLLIWITDDPERINRNAAYASKSGVTVVQLDSTSVAKCWIRLNKDFLKKNDDPRNLRFISDQVLNEVNAEGVPCKNIKAGNEITKFIRDEGFKAPVLIFTSKRGIELTRYVESYANTGSLNGSNDKVTYNKYVEALGRRGVGDTGWMRFGG